MLHLLHTMHSNAYHVDAYRALDFDAYSALDAYSVSGISRGVGPMIHSIDGMIPLGDSVTC